MQILIQLIIIIIKIFLHADFMLNKITIHIMKFFIFKIAFMQIIRENRTFIHFFFQDNIIKCIDYFLERIFLKLLKLFFV